MYNNLVNHKTVVNHSYKYSSTHNLEDGSNQEIIILNQALKTLEVGTFDEKWAISKVLVTYGDLVIAPLREVILNEGADLEHRCFALNILSQLNNPEICLIVSELLATTLDEDLLVLATQTLAAQGKEAIAFLAELIQQQDYCLLACKALAQIPNRLVVEPLLSVVEDEDSEVKKVAICALRNFNDSRIVDVLINALEDYHSEVRKEALVGLGLKLKINQDISLISIITPLLNDINLSVAQQAAMALSRSEHPFAVSALDNVLNSDITPLLLKETIIRVLGWIATTESIDALGKFLNLPDSNSNLKVEIIKILGRVNQVELQAKIIQILDRFYRNNSPIAETQILQNLCYAWKQLKAVVAIPLLQEIENSDYDQVNFHAQSAIKALL
jgi:HEAT repeat protein